MTGPGSHLLQELHPAETAVGSPKKLPRVSGSWGTNVMMKNMIPTGQKDAEQDSFRAARSILI